MITQKLAIVVIGRNEGERLRGCIDALVPVTTQIVYVDSGSTDGSVQMARSRGVTVIDLDMSRPFSAARARNEGFARVRAVHPHAVYVQFVDGDCFVEANWLVSGVNLLKDRPDLLAVFGKLTERQPEASIYNGFSAKTWNPMSEGPTQYMGGNFMTRVETMQKVGGFREQFVVCEDHDLAIRMRALGGQIWYTDIPMATHDLAVYEFSKWWVRAKRGGYGHGLIVSHHDKTPGRPHRREWWRCWLWGLAVPLLAVGGAMAFGVWGLLPLLLYPIKFLRVYFRPVNQHGRDFNYAVLSMASNFAEMLGQAKCLVDQWRGLHPKLIEYK
jgi:glycosyltransferase involved in cell wall biosynthesis